MNRKPGAARAWLTVGALVLAACGASASPTPASTQASPTEEMTRTPGFNAQGVRLCLYEPGVSVVAEMPRDVSNPPVPTPDPAPGLPAPSAVSAAALAAQLNVFDGLYNAVSDHYVYRDFVTASWPDIADRYESLVLDGLSDEDFSMAMKAMTSELRDDHSYYQNAQEVAADEARTAEGVRFVGIGVLAAPSASLDTGSIIAVFPGSPADDAGLAVHDLLLTVDGQPYRDADGIAQSLGPEGTTFTLETQRPGDDVRSIELTRRAVSGFLPVGYCIVPQTRIGYILVPTFLDQNIDGQVREALRRMTVDGPLDGLVVDNRMNGGGSGEITRTVLGFFTSGAHGTFTGISGDEPFDIEAEDIGGSQAVPLVVLAGPDTISYAEVFTGVLQRSGRATVIGMTTGGNVERLHRFDFEDGSRAWLAADAFAPRGLEVGAWEGVGIAPDVEVPTRWDLFTEANDPALARAVTLLSASRSSE